LLRREPIPEADAESAHALHASNAGGQLWAEQPGVGRLVGDAAHRGESEVDGGWGIVALFEVDPMPKTFCTFEVIRDRPSIAFRSQPPTSND
jgi:hypothetical protein